MTDRTDKQYCVQGGVEINIEEDTDVLEKGEKRKDIN